MEHITTVQHRTANPLAAGSTAPDPDGEKLLHSVIIEQYAEPPPV